MVIKCAREFASRIVSAREGPARPIEFASSHAADSDPASDFFPQIRQAGFPRNAWRPARVRRDSADVSPRIRGASAANRLLNPNVSPTQTDQLAKTVAHGPRDPSPDMINRM